MTYFNSQILKLMGASTPRYDGLGPHLRKVHYESPPQNKTTSDIDKEIASFRFTRTDPPIMVLTQQQSREFLDLNWGWFEAAFVASKRMLCLYCNAEQSSVVGERVTNQL